MTAAQSITMEGQPRRHSVCIKATGVARPGKTRHDHATGAWKPKHIRRAAQMARHQEIRESGKRGK